MPLNRKKQPKQLPSFRYTYINYEQQSFDLQKYLDNPSLIEELYKERNLSFIDIDDMRTQYEGIKVRYHKIELQKQEIEINLKDANQKIEQANKNNKDVSIELETLRNQIESQKTDYHKLEMEKQELKIRLDEAKKYSFLTYVLSTLAGLSVSFGVNLITSTPSNWIGWVFIVFGIISGTISFLMSRRGS